MTDLPYGRGGSPLQNLILRGMTETKLTLHLMTALVDCGPIYMKEKLSLHGTAEEIYVRATYLAANMIKEFIECKPVSMPQKGEVVKFERRTPAQSEVPMRNSLAEIYDFIRMLDAKGYPKAFVDWKGFRYQFSNANLYDGRVEATVVIHRRAAAPHV